MLNNVKFIFIAIISCINYTNSMNTKISKVRNIVFSNNPIFLTNVELCQYSLDNKTTPSYLKKITENCKQYCSGSLNKFIHSEFVLRAVYIPKNHYNDKQYSDISKEDLREMLSNDLQEIQAKQKEYCDDICNILRKDLTYSDLKNSLLSPFFTNWTFFFTAKELKDFFYITKQCLRSNNSIELLKTKQFKKKHIIAILLFIVWITKKIDTNFLDKESIKKHEENFDKLNDKLELITNKIELLLMNFIDKLEEVKVNPDNNCSLLEKNLIKNVKIAFFLMAYLKIPIIKNIIIPKTRIYKIPESYFVSNRKLLGKFPNNNNFIMRLYKQSFIIREQKTCL